VLDLQETKKFTAEKKAKMWEIATNIRRNIHAAVDTMYPDGKQRFQ